MADAGLDPGHAPDSVSGEALARIVVGATVLERNVIRIEHTLGTAVSSDTVVVITGQVKRLAPGVDCVRGPTFREMAGDAERADVGVGDADASSVHDRTEALVQPCLVSVVDDFVSGESVDVRLEIEITAGGSEVVEFHDKAGDLLLQADSPAMHKRRFQIGIDSPNRNAGSDDSAVWIDLEGDSGRWCKAGCP